MLIQHDRSRDTAQHTLAQPSLGRHREKSPAARLLQCKRTFNNTAPRKAVKWKTKRTLKGTRVGDIEVVESRFGPHLPAAGVLRQMNTLPGCPATSTPSNNCTLTKTSVKNLPVEYFILLLLACMLEFFVYFHSILYVFRHLRIRPNKAIGTY